MIQTLRLHVAWLVLWTSLLACPRVHAQATVAADVEASRAHFDRGVEYIQDGDLRAALIEFKRAYNKSPNYRVLYNLGQVASELRDYTDAQAYFQRYLSDGADEIDLARRHEVEAQLAKLSGRIATLVLTSNLVGAEVFVDEVSVGLTPLENPVRVSTGTRTISAYVHGRPRITQVVEAAGGETLPVQLEFPAAARQEAAAAPYVASSDAHAHASGPSAAVWLGIGTGVLAIGTGVMAYLAASDASKYHDAVERRTTPRELQSLDDRASTKALVTDILLGATVVTGAVTLVVALQSTGKPETARTQADSTQPRVAVGLGSVRVSGGF